MPTKKGKLNILYMRVPLLGLRIIKAVPKVGARA